jgi:predicted peptidase
LALKVYFSDISAKTDIIDEFAFDTFDGMEYYLYTPEDTSKPQPIMVYLHGNTMAGIQLQFARATSWFASPDVQKKQQTYVFAPTSMLNKTGRYGWNVDEIDTVVKFIEHLVQEGRVDDTRVYIQGNSMGGMGTLTAIMAYPDFFAAAMPMCGTLLQEEDGRSIFASNAEKIVHMPIWFLHAENDTVVKFEDTKFVYDTLTGLGAERVKATWVDDTVLQRYGIYFAHAADIVTTYEFEYADWFFEQRK